MTNNDVPSTVTREELYARVWAEPMQRVAASIGISDVALKKRCTKMFIPVPPRGYWAKKAAGKPTRVTRLPPWNAEKHGTLYSAAFGPVRKKAPKPTLAEAVGPEAEQRRFEALPENRIDVATVLQRPHPLVATSVKTLRGLKNGDRGVMDYRRLECLAVRVSLEHADRAMCLYDALLKALKGRGYTVEVTYNAGWRRWETEVLYGAEKVELRLMERTQRREKPLRELKKGEVRPTWERPEVEWFGTGRMFFRVGGEYSSGIGKNEWGDSATHRLDDLLNEVVVGIVRAGEAFAARSRRWEEQRKLEAEREEHARRLQREREAEQARVRDLLASVKEWNEMRQVRDFVATFDQALADVPSEALAPDVRQWLTWARAYAGRADPVQRLVQRALSSSVDPALPSNSEVR